MQTVIDYDVHARPQNGLRPEIPNSNTVKLVAVKSVNALFLEQNVAINVRSINECTWEQFTPPAQRCPWPPIYPHARNELGVIGAQTELEDPEWLIAELAEDHRIDGGVVMPAMALVAAMPGHDTAHLCWGKNVDI